MSEHKLKELLKTQVMNERGVIYSLALHPKCPHVVYGPITHKLTISASILIDFPKDQKLSTTREIVEKTVL